MTSITIRMPTDVIADLKRLAPHLGFSGYQPLIRAYIGQGLRRDLGRIDRPANIGRLVKSLRRHGVAEEVITSAVAHVREDVARGSSEPLERRRRLVARR